jgi:hypothetical protein
VVTATVTQKFMAQVAVAVPVAQAELEHPKQTEQAVTAFNTVFPAQQYITQAAAVQAALVLVAGIHPIAGVAVNLAPVVRAS